MYSNIALLASSRVAKTPQVHQLLLERREEALRRSVVVAVASAAHARPHPEVLQDRLVVVTGVLASAIRVVKQSGAGFFLHQAIRSARIGRSRPIRESIAQPTSSRV